MKSIRRGFRGFLYRKVIGYGLVCCLVLNTSLPVVLALEAGDMGVNSGVVSTTFGPHTIIDTDHGAIINWNNFDTAGGEIVEFNQLLGGVENSASAVLNRITSGTATQFDGALNANGRVFVVNPAGVIFGAGSTVNVSQLVASGLNMTDDAFNNAIDSPTNEMVFDTGGTGRVVNAGAINANQVYLVGRKVKNDREIQAPNGLIVMAAGETVRFAQDGSSVVVEVLTDPSDTEPDVDNRSLAAAVNGSVVLAAGDTFSRTIRNVGFIIARGGGSVTARAARIENRQTIDVSSYEDGGSILLDGREEILFGPDGIGVHSETLADSQINGNGGSITLQTEGTITFPDGERISARGGDTSGDGGHIKFICDDFNISAPATAIDASPQDSTSNAGTFEIESPTITVADGANAGVQDTVYEQDVEALSTSGTGVVVRGTGTNTGVTVENMEDNQITGGRGGIELHASGDNGSVSFDDTADSISTTRGDIAVSAGSGGVNVGSLETGQDSANPGSIALSTTNGGNIATQNLAIRDGWGHAEISADASSNLTVSGDTAVGRDAAIQNVPDGADAEAIVNFNAGGAVSVGAVTAASHGANATETVGVTRSHININGGAGGAGDVNINGNLVATAISAATGTANATVEVHTPDNVIFAPGVDAPLASVDEGEAEVQSYESVREEISGDVAEIIITQALVQGTPDFGSTHMGSNLAGNVLENDGLENPTASVGTEPEHAASFTLNPDGSYSYTPEEGYVGDDTFTYTATVDGSQSSPITVTITMSNTLPVLSNDAVTTNETTPVLDNVLTNDSDADGDPLTSSLVSGPENAGSFQLNEDGSFSYMPAEGFVGTDTFTYSARDPQVDAAPGQATVTITVNEGPPPTPSSGKEAPPAAPGVDVRIEPEISGKPALVKWVAEEIGVNERVVDVWFANTLASARDIPPVDSYSSFKKSAKILKDATGKHGSALSQVVNEFASSTAPPTEEQMASIAEAISGATESESVYALAGEYVDSLENYVTFLVTEMDFSQQDAVAFVTEKYIDRLAEKESVGVATYVAAELADIFTDRLD